MLVVVVFQHAPEPSISPRDVVELPRLVRAAEDAAVLGKLELDIPLDDMFAVIPSQDIDDEARLGDDAQIWRVVRVVAEERLHLGVNHLLYCSTVGLGVPEDISHLRDCSQGSEGFEELHHS